MRLISSHNVHKGINVSGTNQSQSHRMIEQRQHTRHHSVATPHTTVSILRKTMSNEELDVRVKFKCLCITLFGQELELHTYT